MSSDKPSKAGKTTAKYPKGPIAQHHALATGAPLRKGNTKDLDPSGWGPGAVSGGMHPSGDVGQAGGSKTPKSTFTPC